MGDRRRWSTRWWSAARSTRPSSGWPRPAWRPTGPRCFGFTYLLERSAGCGWPRAACRRPSGCCASAAAASAPGACATPASCRGARASRSRWRARTGAPRRSTCATRRSTWRARSACRARRGWRCARSAEVTGGKAAVPLLERAVEVLSASPARLEHARALTDLGTATSDREPLRTALDLAARLGATALAERAQAALVATGAKPRRPVLTGPDALTAAQLRVARLAADGLGNRDDRRGPLPDREDGRGPPRPGLSQARHFVEGAAPGSAFRIAWANGGRSGADLVGPACAGVALAGGVRASAGRPRLPRAGRAARRRRAGDADPGLPGGRRLAHGHGGLAQAHRPPPARQRDPLQRRLLRRASCSASRSGWRRSPQSARRRSSATAAAATSPRRSRTAGPTWCSRRLDGRGAGHAVRDLGAHAGRGRRRARDAGRAGGQAGASPRAAPATSPSTTAPRSRSRSR